jgi:glycosyltransferase involved in cell wall biosynthesis
VNAAAGVLVAVWAGRRPASFLPTLASLPPGTRVVVGAPDGVVVPAELGLDTVRVGSVARFLAAAAARHRGPLVLVAEPVLFPADDPFGRALTLAADVRVGTVSFLSNASIWAQYHGDLGPQHWATFGLDQTSVTARLRARPTDADVAALLFAHGGAVLIGRSLLDLTDGDELAQAGTVAGAFSDVLADLSLHARRRGLLDLVDATTYVAQPLELAGPGDGLVSDDGREELIVRHSFARDVLRLHPEPHAPATLALQVARMKVMGVRVVLDGTRLGPFETGTQVGVVALATTLAARTDVEWVGVTMAGPWPPYARSLGQVPKVRVVAPDEPLVPPADMFFRPYQADAQFSVATARALARRVMVNVLDLIAYQIGAYFPTPESWWEYRAAQRTAAQGSDGVATISRDVAAMLRLERVDVEPSRLFPIPFGADHLTGDEPTEPPVELIAAGVADRSFLLCLGTNFSHKNRDVAVRAHAELRRRGHEHLLVLAGPAVPYGSSRVAEARARLRQPDDGVLVLPDVPTAARNWLLRHAAAVLYPTSSEGFGLVPYEAAVFGTPCVFVPFGPLAEIAGTTLGTARDFSPDAVADATEALLGDPALASRQVGALRDAGARHTWAETARELTDAFFSVLARAPIQPEGGR